MTSPVDDDLLRKGAEAAAALERGPSDVRLARSYARGFEERAVKAVLSMMGEEGRSEELRRQARAVHAESLTFPLFHEFVETPVVFRAARLRFDFDSGLTTLMNGFAHTPMWAAWEEMCGEGRDDARPGALVFSWPRVAGCSNGLCVFHEEFPGTALLGTRVQREVNGSIYEIETLPSLMMRTGMLADVDKWRKSASKR